MLFLTLAKNGGLVAGSAGRQIPLRIPQGRSERCRGEDDDAAFKTRWRKARDVVNYAPRLFLAHSRERAREVELEACLVGAGVEVTSGVWTSIVVKEAKPVGLLSSSAII